VSPAAEVVEELVDVAVAVSDGEGEPLGVITGEGDDVDCMDTVTVSEPDALDVVERLSLAVEHALRVEMSVGTVGTMVVDPLRV